MAGAYWHAMDTAVMRGRPSNLFIISLLGIAVAVCIGSYVQASRLSRLHRRLAQLEAENATLLRHLKSPSTTRSAASDHASLAAPVGAGATSATATSSSPVESALQLLNGRLLPPDAMKADIEFAYARFLRQAKLDPQQLLGFERTVAEHQWKEMEIESVARSEHLSRSDPTIVSLSAEERERFRDELRTTLGHDAFAAFEQAQSMRPMRAVADEMAAATVSSSTPFTSDQAEQLMKILTAASKPAPEGQGRNFDWDQIVAEAARVLSPTQMAALQAIRSRWVIEQRD